MDTELACPLCSHISRTMKGYVEHCEIHSNDYSKLFKCSVKGCKSEMPSYTAFRTHVYRDHQGVNSRNVSDQLLAANIGPFQCNVARCQQISSEMQELLKHLRQHITIGVIIQCPFTMCHKEFF